MGRLFLTSVLLAGCTCSFEPATLSTHADPAPEIEPVRGLWPEASIELDPRPAATRVTVHALDRIEVSNAELIDTWPAAAIERARADLDPAHPAWPRIHLVIDHAPHDRGVYRELLDAMRAARRAERASTGAGSGAGVYDLRLASAIDFAMFEDVLRTSAQAGYGTPRVLLSDGEGLARFEWPHARAASAPSEAAIRRAAAAIARGEEPHLPLTFGDSVQVVLRDAAVEVGLASGSEGAPTCEAVDDPALVAACLRGRSVTLSVAPSERFSEVVLWAQHLSRTAESLRVVSR